jgi:hypothetical protein
MIKRYLLTAKKENKIENEIFFEMSSAEKMQLVYINSGYKTQILPLSIDLARHEIEEHYQDEIEKENILSDFLYQLKDYYDVPEDDFENIKKDIDVIYFAFKKCEDSDSSYWQNIEKTIDYLKDLSATNYDYSKIN